MTAIAAIFHRDGAPASEAQLRPMLDAMAYRGPEGVHVEALGSTAVGLRELCVLPEDEGVEWPVWDKQHRAGIVFDGRLDNREELLEQLAERHELRREPDARLALEAYLQWGSDSFARLIGEFAFIIHEPQSQALTAVRDPMGCRRLCYTQAGSTFLIASEEQALLAHPLVEARVNERHVAAQMAIGKQAAGETYFQDIFDLLPAHWMRIDRQRVTTRQYWRLPRATQYWKLKPGEAAELYREKLKAAVKARLRGRSPAAVLLSGGLDSSALIAVATEIVTTEAQKPVAVSWVFDCLQECDERSYESQTCALLGLRHLPVVSDHLWPLYDRQRYTPHTVNDMILDFCGASWACFDRIRDEGMQIELSGRGGDELFMAQNYWLRDLFASGRFREAGGAMTRRLMKKAPVMWLRDPVLRRLFPFNGIRRQRTIEREWLTAHARNLLPVEPRTDLLTGRSWGFDRFESAVSLRNARDISIAHAKAQRWSIDTREPFRDLRLVEYVLNLPAYHFYDHIEKCDRPLQRDVMRHRLPAAVVNRAGKTSFTALFNRGVYSGAADQVRAVLCRSSAVWPEYVDRRWLMAGLEAGGKHPLYNMVLWCCICLELWTEALQLVSKKT